MVAKKKEDRPTRFAFIIPKKIDKRTTKRNRTHRLLATAVRQLLPNVKNGYEVMIIAKKVSEKEKLEDIKPSIKEILKKAEII